MAAVNLIRAFQALSSEKEAVRKREEQFVSELRAILGRLGYRMEPVGGNGTTRGTSRPAGRRRAGSAGRSAVRCPECGRTFALALHLGRHMSATHQNGGKAPQAGAAASQSAVPAREIASSAKARATKPRRGMSPAARRAAAKRMKAYWRKKKAATAKAGRRRPRAGARRPKSDAA